MKIGRFANGMDIALTAQEAVPFMGKRLTVDVKPDAQREFVTIRASDTGPYKLARRQDSVYPWYIGLHKSIYGNFKPFRTEEVDSWSPGDGILHGVKPTMKGAPTQRTTRRDKGIAKGPAPFTPKQGGFEHVKQAVQLINNFKTTYGEQAELRIEDGRLVVQFLIQF